MSRRDKTVKNPFARAYVLHLLERGVSVETIAASARTSQVFIEQGVSNGQELLLSLDQYYRLMNSMAAYFQDEAAYGLRLAQQDVIRDINVYHALVRYSATVRDAFTVVSEYGRLLSPGYHIDFTEHGDFARLTYRITERTTECPRHDIEYAFSRVMLSFARSNLTSHTPVRVLIRCPPPHSTRAQRLVFGSSLFYSQDTSAVEFNAAVLDQPLSRSDPVLLAALRRQAEHMLAAWAHESDLCSQVKMVLMGEVHTGQVTAQTTADALHMSRSTLHRRLALESTSFKALRDDVVSGLAKQALKTDAKIGDIALLLGYSEHSAFVHAFRRVVGVSPLEYRRQAAAAPTQSDVSVGDALTSR